MIGYMYFFFTFYLNSCFFLSTWQIYTCSCMWKKERENNHLHFLKKVHSSMQLPYNMLLITWTTKHDLVDKLTVTFTSSAAFQIGDGRTPRRRQAWYWVRFTSTSIWRLYQFLEKHLCWKVDLLMNWNNVNNFFLLK